MKKKFRSDHQTVSNLPPLDEIAQQLSEKTPTEVKISEEKVETVAFKVEQNKQQEIYSTGCQGRKALEEMLGFTLTGYKK